MFKKFLFVLITGLLLSGCSLPIKKAGIEIMSQSVARVYIDGKEAGNTPYKNTTLKPGLVTIRLEDGDKSWEREIELKSGVTTIVDWELAEKTSESAGYILYLEKTGDETKSGLLVNASPDKTAVAIDDVIKGVSPVRLPDIGVEDKKITLSFPGYKTINVFIKAMPGYQLLMEAKLAKEEALDLEQMSEFEQIEISTPSGQMSQIIEIQETGVGWLRVREASSGASAEIDKVNPGERYELLEESDDWYKIKLEDDKEGWVSASYVEKI